MLVKDMREDETEKGGQDQIWTAFGQFFFFFLKSPQPLLLICSLRRYFQYSRSEAAPDLPLVT